MTPPDFQDPAMHLIPRTSHRHVTRRTLQFPVTTLVMQVAGQAAKLTIQTRMRR